MTEVQGVLDVHGAGGGGPPLPAEGAALDERQAVCGEVEVGVEVEEFLKKLICNNETKLSKILSFYSN